MHLKGKTAIVTGATRGIGKSIALKLASEGANIAFNYVSSEEQSDALAIQLASFGVKAKGFKVDVRDYDKVVLMKNQVVEEFGSIEILINNAGIIKDSALLSMSVENWKEVIDVNLTGVFNFSKAVIVNFMKQQKGDIINISSLSGIIGLPKQTNYSASKGGVIAFTKALAKEVAGFNVRVNAVAPGFIETDMVSELNPNLKNKMLEFIPQKRFGKSEEVADLVNFLLSEKIAYLTGQVIQIDGGMGI